MDQAEWKLLKEIAELEKTPQGAYNIRRNGALDSRLARLGLTMDAQRWLEPPGEG